MNLFPVFLHLLYLALPTFAAETAYVILVLREGRIGRIRLDSGDTVEMVKVDQAESADYVSKDPMKDVVIRVLKSVLSPSIFGTNVFGPVESTDGFFLWKGPKGTVAISQKNSDGSWTDPKTHPISSEVTLINLDDNFHTMNVQKSTFLKSVLNSGHADARSGKWLLDWMEADTTNNGP
eukprot:GHVS01004315.1.p1 GENE.GHVS01004315.1~~GHVS01004315.1.p1  ORF type:complete len:179 (+),score=4.47 GHVS01004315.1:269-805(+)